MVSRSIISMSSKPLSARVLSSSHPVPPAPTMRTADRDEGGRSAVAGRVGRVDSRDAHLSHPWRAGDRSGVVIADVKLERRARAAFAPRDAIMGSGSGQRRVGVGRVQIARRALSPWRAEIAHGRRHRGRQARTSRARRVLPRGRDHLCRLGAAEQRRPRARQPQVEITKSVHARVRLTTRASPRPPGSSLTVDAPLPVLRSSLRAPPRLAFTSASLPLHLAFV